MAEGDVRPPGGSQPGGPDPPPAHVPKDVRIDPPPDSAEPEGSAGGESPTEPVATGEVEPQGPEQAPPAKPRKGGINPFIELVLILAVAFGLAYLVQGWVVKPYRIPSVSMEPTLKVGDMVLVNRFIYRVHGPRRGDIIVFHPPGRGQVPIRGATTEASVNFKIGRAHV